MRGYQKGPHRQNRTLKYILIFQKWMLRIRCLDEFHWLLAELRLITKQKNFLIEKKDTFVKT